MAQCACFGEKTVLEVYEDDLGEGVVLIDGEEYHGTIRAVKEHCHVCGEVYLMRMTFPKLFDGK